MGCTSPHCILLHTSPLQPRATAPGSAAAVAAVGGSCTAAAAAAHNDWLLWVRTASVVGCTAAATADCRRRSLCALSLLLLLVVPSTGATSPYVFCPLCVGHASAQCPSCPQMLHGRPRFGHLLRWCPLALHREHGWCLCGQSQPQCPASPQKKHAPARGRLSGWRSACVACSPASPKAPSPRCPPPPPSPGRAPIAAAFPPSGRHVFRWHCCRCCC